MDYEVFNQFCAALTATTHVVQWGNADVWKVGGKVFAIGGWGDDGKPAIVFKTSDTNYEFLSNRPGYKPAPYFANRGMKWIQCFDTNADNPESLEYYISESYKLVVAKLSKKRQRELGLA